ncbi:DUF551 domain-containing protein, partial [Huaxiibacter chinensis]|uniref:DUF551 domain-containing protein n=1 Tax=Huaxiibacter chinensis TaxID=2899785 RepID=UPI003D31F7AF
AIAYVGSQQLRAQLSAALAIFVEPDHPHTRAAMQGKADGTLIGEGTIPATQFKPVADLYGITSPTGSETSFTFDAVEARYFIDGGWSCQEYVELERFQEVMIGNSPVIPDGWVACSERMPDKLIPVMVMYADGEMWSALWTGTKWDDGTEFPDPHPVTHWQEMPAAPQQEA